MRASISPTSPSTMPVGPRPAPAADARSCKPAYVAIETSQDQDLRSIGSPRARADSSPSRFSVSSSFTQKTPARSFFHRTSHGTTTPLNFVHGTSQDVRHDTEQLASWASEDVISLRKTRDSTRQQFLSPVSVDWQNSDLLGVYSESEMPSYQRSDDSSRPQIIQEISEPASPEIFASSQTSSCALTLSQTLSRSPFTEENNDDQEDESSFENEYGQPVIVGEGIISQPDERTALLVTKASLRLRAGYDHDTSKDLENQQMGQATRAAHLQHCLEYAVERGVRFGRSIVSPKSWDRKDLWN